MNIFKSITNKNIGWLNNFKIVFVIFFVIFLSVRLFIAQSEFNKAKLQILQSNSDAQSHLLMANIASDAFDWFLAQKELMKAYSNLRKSDNRIFGMNTQFEEIKNKAYSEYYLLKEIDYWTKVVRLQPNYLDGYLKLSLLYYQNNNLDIAIEFWKKALSIDPNSLKAYEIGKALSFVGEE